MSCRPWRSASLICFFPLHSFLRIPSSRGSAESFHSSHPVPLHFCAHQTIWDQTVHGTEDQLTNLTSIVLAFDDVKSLLSQFDITLWALTISMSHPSKRFPLWPRYNQCAFVSSQTDIIKHITTISIFLYFFCTSILSAETAVNSFVFFSFFLGQCTLFSFSFYNLCIYPLHIFTILIFGFESRFC